MVGARRPSRATAQPCHRATGQQRRALPPVGRLIPLTGLRTPTGGVRRVRRTCVRRQIGFQCRPGRAGTRRTALWTVAPRSVLETLGYGGCVSIASRGLLGGRFPDAFFTAALTGDRVTARLCRVTPGMRRDLLGPRATSSPIHGGARDSRRGQKTTWAGLRRPSPPPSPRHWGRALVSSRGSEPRALCPTQRRRPKGRPGKSRSPAPEEAPRLPPTPGEQSRAGATSAARVSA